MQTRFPDVSIEIPMMTVEGTGEFRSNLRLRTCTEAIITWLRNNEDVSLRTWTFRQACECFADHALSYYIEAGGEDRRSNLYEKMPDLCKEAREVAFDFSSGISENRRTPARNRVISNLNARLFMTEGNKATFEARGTVERMSCLTI
uniref:Structural protein n=1 Tax=Darwin betaflexivirus 1 TaxID=2201304 RepID=A0A2U8JQD1_9VIRU|nr:structural protein [Darwin betaflexivirus 1]